MKISTYNEMLAASPKKAIQTRFRINHFFEWKPISGSLGRYRTDMIGVTKQELYPVFYEYIMLCPSSSFNR
jgi:hypothetical protein